MSILGAVTGELDVRIVRGMILLTGVAVLFAMVAGVFRRRSVLGPVRWDERESPATIFMLIMVGVFGWLSVPILYGATHPRATPTTAPTTAPTTSSATAPAESVQPIPPADVVRVSAIGALAGFIAMAAANIFGRPDGLKRIGLTARSLPPGLPRAGIGILIILPMMTWAGVFTQSLWKMLHIEHPSEHDLLRLLGETDQSSLRQWIIVSAVVIAPLAEEMLFRGHIQTLAVMLFTSRWTRLATPPVTIETPIAATSVMNYETPPAVSPQREVIARWLAILITSILFAAIHPWWTAPAIFCLAICLGYAYERTGNLWVPILMHSAFNATSVWFYLYTLR